MAIRKRKNRAAAYCVYWRNPATGKQDSRSFSTLAEARKHDSLIKHRIAHEPQSFAEEQDSPHGSVKEIMSLYLATRKMSPRNTAMTLYHLKSVMAALGDRQAATICKKDLLSFITNQEREGVKRITAHRRLSILRAALTWATEQEIIESNPIMGVIIKVGHKEHIAPPTEVELRSIISHSPPHLVRAILLAVNLGVRVGPTELLSLKWADVDLSRGFVRVWSAKKNTSIPYRDIPLRSDFSPIMRAWQEADSELMPETIVHIGGRNIASIKTAWKKAKENAGITRRLRPYDLRHAFATMTLAAGADLKTVAAIMGHADATMILRHYQHVLERDKVQAVESLPCMSSLYVQQKKAHDK